MAIFGHIFAICFTTAEEEVGTEGTKRHFTELRRQERGDKKRFYQEEECIRGCFDKTKSRL